MHIWVLQFTAKSEKSSKKWKRLSTNHLSSRRWLDLFIARSQGSNSARGHLLGLLRDLFQLATPRGFRSGICSGSYQENRYRIFSLCPCFLFFSLQLVSWVLVSVVNTSIVLLRIKWELSWVEFYKPLSQFWWSRTLISAKRTSKFCRYWWKMVFLFVFLYLGHTIFFNNFAV